MRIQLLKHKQRPNYNTAVSSTNLCLQNTKSNVNINFMLFLRLSLVADLLHHSMKHERKA